VPRAPAASRVFAALAEPRRRRILDLLGRSGPLAAGVLVRRMRLPQPTVSKHLGVLRAAGVVTSTRRGRLRVYHLNGAALRPVHDWITPYERFWSHHLGLIKESAERAARSHPTPPPLTPREK